MFTRARLPSGAHIYHRFVYLRSDDLWDSLVNKLMMRCKDKLSIVRENAVMALKRLQDTENPDDPVTKLLVRTLMTDSSKYAAAVAQSARVSATADPHPLTLPSLP